MKSESEGASHRLHCGPAWFVSWAHCGGLPLLLRSSSSGRRDW